METRKEFSPIIEIDNLEEPPKLLEYRFSIEKEALNYGIEIRRLFALDKLFGNRYFQIAADGIDIPDKHHCLLLALRCLVVIDDDITDGRYRSSNFDVLNRFSEKIYSDSEIIAASISSKAKTIVKNAAKHYRMVLKKMSETGPDGWKIHSLEIKMKQMEFALIPFYLLIEYGFDEKFTKKVTRSLFFILKAMQVFDDLYDIIEDEKDKIKTSISNIPILNRNQLSRHRCRKYLNKAKLGLKKESMLAKYIETFYKLIAYENFVFLDRKDEIFPVQPILVCD